MVTISRILDWTVFGKRCVYRGKCSASAKCEDGGKGTVDLKSFLDAGTLLSYNTAIGSLPLGLCFFTHRDM